MRRKIEVGDRVVMKDKRTEGTVLDMWSEQSLVVVWVAAERQGLVYHRDDVRRVYAHRQGSNVAHEVNPAALPGGVEHLADGGLDALVGVRDHELDAAQTAAGELAEEGAPERLGLGGAGIHAEDP